MSLNNWVEPSGSGRHQTSSDNQGFSMRSRPGHLILSSVEDPRQCLATARALLFPHTQLQYLDPDPQQTETLGRIWFQVLGKYASCFHDGAEDCVECFGNDDLDDCWYFVRSL
jgi:hypothetical protein